MVTTWIKISPMVTQVYKAVCIEQVINLRRAMFTLCVPIPLNLKPGSMFYCVLCS